MTGLQRRLLALFALTMLAAPVWSAEPTPRPLGHHPAGGTAQTSDYTGRVLVVTFWASWCAPCLNEMSVLERLQREAADRLAVVSVNIEGATRFAQLRSALQESLRLTLTHDPEGSVRQAWGVGPIPHLFMIDHEGRLAYEHRGYDDDFIPTLVEQVNLLLLRQAASSP